jgi:formylglycine-generating enzyme
VVIAAGCFPLGPPKPFGVLVPRRVCLPVFRIDRTEVTVAQFRACVEAGGCTPPTSAHRLCTFGRPGSDAHPVNCVGYEAAAGFCRWQGRRLPTPDEWERAARGPSLSTYPWGEEPPTAERATLHRHLEGRCAGVGDRRPPAGRCAVDEGTTQVCSHRRGLSAEGLCDMAGNVAEWVAGYWPDSGLLPSAEPSDGDVAQGGRMTRGGSFGQGAAELRSWMRSRYAATAPATFRDGFRCAADAPAGP